MADLTLCNYEEFDVDFDGLRSLVTGQAADVMDEVAEAGAEEDFMNHLISVFGDYDERGLPPTLDEVWDYIRYDFKEIYDAIDLH